MARKKIIHLRDRRTGETFEIVVPNDWRPDTSIYDVLRESARPSTLALVS